MSDKSTAGTRTVHIAIPRDLSAPCFPDRCVCCGAPGEAESKLNVSRTIKAGQGKKNVEKSVTWAVPHCRRCERSTKAVFLAGCVPFALGFVLCGLAALVVGAGVATYYDDGSTSPLGSNTSWQIGVVVGLVAGLLGGVVFELAGADRFAAVIWPRAVECAPVFDGALRRRGLCRRARRDDERRRHTDAATLCRRAHRRRVRCPECGEACPRRYRVIGGPI